MTVTWKGCNIVILLSEPKRLHINVLELRAAGEAVAELVRLGDICRLHIDNKVAVAYITKQGGTKSSALNWEAFKLWGIVQQKGATLITPHWISTKENSVADFLTRHNIKRHGS